MHKKWLIEELNLTQTEIEIIGLQNILDMIDAMINLEMMEFYGSPPHEVRMKSSSHQKLFIILLTDFLSKIKDILPYEKYNDFLLDICKSHLFGENTENLRKSVEIWINWLNSNVIVKNLYLCSQKKSFDLEISKEKLIVISGNIDKHNIANLSYNIEKIREIIEHKDITNKDVFKILNDLHERFKNDYLIRYTSIITEMLNNIRIEILNYLKSIYQKSISNEYEKKHIYIYPSNVSSDVGEEFFTRLMNSVGRDFYIKNFKVTRNLRKN